MSQPLLIVGASVRAAASSAIRAGFTPYGIDLFADLDLASQAHCLRARPFPAAVPGVAEQMPEAPWMYTGAFENHPDIVHRLSRQRQLYGNMPDVLRAVRDPHRWTDALHDAGLSVPEVFRGHRELPRDGTWLRKPLRSSAGTGLERWTAESMIATSDNDHYFQRYVDGVSCSGVFVGAAGRSVFLGATEQLVGTPWCGATGFQYAGSIGPLALSDSETHRWSRIGSVLVERFGLTGLFGVDAVCHEGAIWPVEINPRYTASAELLDRADSISVVGYHVAACRAQRLPSAHPQSRSGMHGKAIVFAGQDVTVSERFVSKALDLNRSGDAPAWADIPEVGSVLRLDQPILTVFASAPTVAAVRQALEQEANAVRCLLRQKTCKA